MGLSGRVVLPGVEGGRGIEAGERPGVKAGGGSEGALGVGEETLRRGLEVESWVETEAERLRRLDEDVRERSRPPSNAGGSAPGP